MPEKSPDISNASPDPISGEKLRELLRGNSEFKVMWIGGVRYEMPKDEEPVSGVRSR